MATIPCIDFTPYLSDSPPAAPTPAQAKVAAQIDAAFRTHGFLTLSHILIPLPTISACFTAASALFALPAARKAALPRLHPDLNVGYSPPATEHLNARRAPDLKEAFNISDPARNPALVPAALAPVAHELWHRVRFAAGRFALACAHALHLPPDFFLRAMQAYDNSIVRLNHYPPCAFRPGVSTGEAAGAALRVGEHTDFGMFTFLFADAPGLQVMPVKGGGWVDVGAPEGGGVIVNTGALMARWTNDAWKATPHRVVVADEDVGKGDRYSIACFIEPDRKAVVQPHPRFGDAAYPPITTEVYTLERLTEARVS